jgi:hypothetical protein
MNKLHRKDFSIAVKKGTDANKSKFAKEAVLGEMYYATDTGSLYVANNNAGSSDALLTKYEAINYAIDFDGTDDRVEFADMSFLNSATAFSISLWVKSSSTGTTMMMFQSGSDTFGNSIGFYRGSAGIVDFLIGIGGTSASYIRYSSEIFDGTWKHLVATYDGSAQILYIDGSPVSTTKIGSNVPTSTVSTAGTSPHIASNISNSLNVHGKIDDFAIFNSALTAGEVASIYSNSIYDQSKLVHFYKFENNYNDSKGSLNGTPQGNPTFTTDTP